MTDAVRYHMFNEATFSTWFNFAATSVHVHCPPYKYELLSSLTPVTLNTDSIIQLTGTIGAHIIKIDMTQSTNVRSFWLRATTWGGAIIADKPIEIVNCP